MNTQQTQTQARPAAPKTAGMNPVQKRRHRPAKQLLALLRSTMLVLGGLIVVMGMLLIILPMFRVRSIEVLGTQYYQAEDIITGAGLAEGDEILSVNAKEVSQRIYENCKFVSGVKIKRGFSKISITISEYENMVYTEYEGRYYVLNKDLKVLGAYDTTEKLCGIMPIQLPEIASLTVGKTASFVKGDVSMDYIKELLTALESTGTLARVSSLDCSKKYGVSYVLAENTRIELGKVSEMDAKLALAEEIMTLKVGATEACAIINVSDIQKPTYRAVAASELSAGV